VPSWYWASVMRSLQADGPGPWVTQAACTVRHNMSDDNAPAACLVCRACPVQSQCTVWACGTPDPVPGLVAGGMTTGERDRVRRAIDLGRGRDR
jgi:hypothetical protein